MIINYYLYYIIFLLLLLLLIGYDGFLYILLGNCMYFKKILLFLCLMS